MLVDSGADWSIIREDTYRKVVPCAIRTLIPESSERAATATRQAGNGTSVCPIVAKIPLLSEGVGLRDGETMPATAARCAQIASDTSRPTPTGHLTVKGEAHIGEMIRCVDVEPTLAQEGKLRAMLHKARKVFGTCLLGVVS
ncbi:hypothetical protein D918_07398 [Trichuris suis]|uniref:Uncharacterized protein n=1 Tax=Trichuris suis TaxID=68888 RepID=A0A085LV67_9BILA|nr:hypothetical protein M513_10226 [Trichuris suis]KHJ42476.1 hypothetical protein D918_07398 [Trichuris suis]